MNKETVELLPTLALGIAQAGGRLLVVGGAVRDRYFSSFEEGKVKDIDCEVYSLDYTEICQVLNRLGLAHDTVGQSFSVVKLKDHPVDIAQPRREVKTGPLHTDFEIVADPDMLIEEACARRDFTINAVAYDPLTREVVDPFGGVMDMKNRVLHATSDRFSEDPLRVLRAMQFVSRFNLWPTPELIAACRSLSDQFFTLSSERVFEEWNKMLLKGLHIKRALEFLAQADWLRHFPELAALQGVEQDSVWHPEGDCWVHTGHCMDSFARNRTGNETDLVVGYAVLGHDFGKSTTTKKDENGKIHAYGHEDVSGPLLHSFLSRLTNEAEFIHQAVQLAQAHMRPGTLWNDRSSQPAIRRLACQVGRIDLLMQVYRADQEGRPPLASQYEECCQWIMEQAAALGVQASRPKGLVMGRHLIEQFGLKPGPLFRELLTKCFEAQIDGQFSTLEGGLMWLASLLKEKDQNNEN